MELVTKDVVANAFNAICSQIGELYCQRELLLDQVASLDERLAALKFQRAQAITQQQTLDHNEKVAELEKAKTPPKLASVKGEQDAD